MYFLIAFFVLLAILSEILGEGLKIIFISIFGLIFFIIIVGLFRILWLMITSF